MSTPAVVPLAEQLERLRDPDKEVRLEARRALESCGPADGDAVPALAGAVFRRVAGVRVIAGALGRIGPGAAAAVPQLLGLLGDASSANRLAASSALAGIGPPAADRAVPAMSRMLDTERNEEVRDQVAHDLAELALMAPGDSAGGAVQALRQVAEDDAVDAAAREHARRALSKLGALPATDAEGERSA